MTVIIKSIGSKIVLLGIFFLLSGELYSQSKTVALANGDGWYRIVTGGHPRAGGMVRISGGLGNNRVTLMTLYVSFMGYNQQGAITIVDNLYYNTNHVDLIRCGSIGGGLSALDFHFIGIIGTPNLLVEVDGINLSIPDTSEFEPTLPIGLTEISGRVLGISSDRWPVYMGSKVGIGTTSPSEKLEVAGTIRSKEVKVEAAPWPDYVFSENYDLPSLEETEAYIKAHKHLPGIPSAEEVSEEGIALGEMNAKLLEKIEELMLYQIEMMKKLEQQQDQIDELSAKLSNYEK